MPDFDATSPSADLFISYSHVDEPFGRRFEEALRGHGKEPWIDYDDIPPGERWASELKLASSAPTPSRSCSLRNRSRPRSASRSSTTRAGWGKRVIPLHLRRTSREGMPALLREHNWLPAHGRLFDGEMVVYGDSRGTLRYFACDICGSVIASSCSPAGGSPGS